MFVFLGEMCNFGLRYLLLLTLNSKLYSTHRSYLYRGNCDRPVTNVKEQIDN